MIGPSDGTVHNVFPVSVNRDEGEALRRWVMQEHASRTVEVGLGYGIAALFVCDGLLANGEDAHHATIDPNQDTRFANCGLEPRVGDRRAVDGGRRSSLGGSSDPDRPTGTAL